MDAAQLSLAVEFALKGETDMRVRIKFSKQGVLKYIGHLDTMRFFQKLMRRSEIPIAYSAGMSPHQIMSFALPLGIGDESLGEYLDIELTESVNSSKAVNVLNNNCPEGIQILSFKELPEKAVNAMASVYAADYCISVRDDFAMSYSGKISEFFSLNNIVTIKKTKKNEQEIDIRPFVFSYEFKDNKLYLRLKCGSVDHTKPELVLKAFCEYVSCEYNDNLFKILRLDLLTDSESGIISLDDIGKEII